MWATVLFHYRWMRVAVVTVLPDHPTLPVQKISGELIQQIVGHTGHDDGVGNAIVAHKLIFPDNRWLRLVKDNRHRMRIAHHFCPGSPQAIGKLCGSLVDDIASCA